MENVLKNYDGSCVLRALMVFENDGIRENALEKMCPITLTNLYQVGFLAKCFDRITKKPVQLIKQKLIIIEKNIEKVNRGSFMEDFKNIDDVDKLYLLDRFKNFFSGVCDYNIHCNMRNFPQIVKAFDIFDIKTTFTDENEYKKIGID